MRVFLKNVTVVEESTIADAEVSASLQRKFLGPLRKPGFDLPFYRLPFNTPGTIFDAETGDMHSYFNIIDISEKGRGWLIFRESSFASSSIARNVVSFSGFSASGGNNWEKWPWPTVFR